tara:strand:+ start:121 stop:312 length:192 start_codon:yes stop_codon:yes gene_type:complete
VKLAVIDMVVVMQTGSAVIKVQKTLVEERVAHPGLNAAIPTKVVVQKTLVVAASMLVVPKMEE